MRLRPATIVPPPLVYAAGLGTGWWLQHRWPAGFTAPSWLHAAAWSLLIASVTLMLWAALTIWQHRTTVNPYGAVSALVTSGPFAFSRNPIYLADAWAYAAVTALIGSWWPLLFAPAVWGAMHFGVIVNEEVYLAEKFGDEYRHYSGRVRRWLGTTGDIDGAR